MTDSKILIFFQSFIASNQVNANQIKAVGHQKALTVLVSMGIVTLKYQVILVIKFNQTELTND